MEELPKGVINRIAQFYNYCLRGLEIINNFKNLGLLIVAIYFSLKLSHWWWMGVMFFGSLPIIVVIGYFNTHYLAKIIELINTKYGTTFGIRQFRLQEEVLKTLKEIKEKL